MNSNLIDFIDYDDEYRHEIFPKLEIEFENPKPYEKFEDNFFDDPFQQNLNPPGLDRLNSNIFSSIFQSESQQMSLNYQSSASEQQQSVHITYEKKEELSTNSDDGSTNHALPDPISTKSRRIMKREKAKQINERKQREKQQDQKEKQQDQKQFKLTEEAILSGEIPAKFIPKGYHQNLDEKAKKKMLQMIRNRISAQNSRDRKKNLIDHLENQQRVICEENLVLKTRVRQLEQENVQLRKENQEMKKTLNNGVIPGLFDEVPSSNPSTDSPNMSGNSSPVFRKAMRSGGFMKYSLALATIFAVLMFNGMNTTTNLQAKAEELVSNAPQQPIFEVPAPKIPARVTRLLADTLNASIVEPDSKPLVQPDSTSIVVKMEEEYPVNQPCVTTDLSDYPFISQLGNLQQNFNEKYMSQFFSQLKIVDPIVLNNFQQTINLSLVPEQKSGSDINFPSYLRASRRQLPDYSKSKDSNQTLIVPFVGGNSKLPIIKNDNFSSLFCPSGFEFQGEGDNSFVKIEDDTVASQKKLKILDSEWLQLFVPKNNIAIAKLTEEDGLYIKPTENDSRDDNTIMEVWCKVFFIRELPSAF